MVQGHIICLGSDLLFPTFKKLGELPFFSKLAHFWGFFTKVPLKDFLGVGEKGVFALKFPQRGFWLYKRERFWGKC